MTEDNYKNFDIGLAINTEFTLTGTTGSTIQCEVPETSLGKTYYSVAIIGSFELDGKTKGELEVAVMNQGMLVGISKKENGEGIPHTLTNGYTVGNLKFIGL